MERFNLALETLCAAVRAAEAEAEAVQLRPVDGMSEEAWVSRLQAEAQQLEQLGYLHNSFTCQRSGAANQRVLAARVRVAQKLLLREQAWGRLDEAVDSTVAVLLSHSRHAAQLTEAEAHADLASLVAPGPMCKVPPEDLRRLALLRFRTHHPTAATITEVIVPSVASTLAALAAESSNPAAQHMGADSGFRSAVEEVARIGFTACFVTRDAEVHPHVALRPSCTAYGVANSGVNGTTNSDPKQGEG